MKRFLVTGAQGFVGRHLVAELLEADPDALVVGVGRSAPCPSTFSYGMPLPSELARRLAATEKRYRYM
ncbi:MAG: NAD-dependent epimerase/dehydratase family protein, partial [Myxococcaceae bacterium]